MMKQTRIHDFEIHKENYPTYLEYLKKTESERGMIAADQDVRWAILGDKAYYTSNDNEATVGERRIRECYRFDHCYFDEDFDNCVMLTNELIRNNQLNDPDREFYRQFVQMRKDAANKRANKQREAYQQYAINKRQRRESLF